MNTLLMMESTDVYCSILREQCIMTSVMAGCNTIQSNFTKSRVPMKGQNSKLHEGPSEMGSQVDGVHPNWSKQLYPTTFRRHQHWNNMNHLSCMIRTESPAEPSSTSTSWLQSDVWEPTLPLACLGYIGHHSVQNGQHLSIILCLSWSGD